jgi:hypothetical protein
MFTLILPVAGKSSRFPDMRPKWLLTMPDGLLMIEKAVEGIDLALFTRIVIVCLKDHLIQYTNKENVIASFFAATGYKPEIAILDEPTSSQSETICKAIEATSIKGAIFIKDCDNVFSCIPSPKNNVATVNLNTVELIDAKNKSYVEADSLGVISNIIEKEVISNQFCCGGYGFENSQDFVSTYEKIETEHEVYISHIIYNMLLEGAEFSTSNASEYIDWGTLREYRHYCRQYITMFCDVDGVLLKNGSKFSKNAWKTKGIKRNLIKIASLQQKGGLYLILTSSRPESEEEYTIKELASHGIRTDRCVFGLPHTRRFLVNDYSPTNPYPSAVSINLERDSELLDTLFDD